jgi:Ca-activated chloride channel homolog
MKSSFKRWIVIIIMGSLIIGGLYKSETGSLKGKVTDINGNSIPGVAVYIPSLAIRGAADINGNYIILNIPVGTYEIHYSMIGYQKKVVKGISISTDKIVWLNTSLITQIIEGEAVEVLAQKPKVEKNQTSKKTQIWSQHSIEPLPIRDNQKLYTLQSGGVMVDRGLHNKNGLANLDAYMMKNQITNSEDYGFLLENTFQDALHNPLSTFSIDVDNASYANIRRFLMHNRLMPPKDAVRIEEMINYFTYDYPQPDRRHPFSIYTKLSDCPWNRNHQLVHIGLQGRKVDYDDLKPSNLVFLLDVSGSMSSRNKLPLLKKSFKMLVKELSREDRIAIVVYAGDAGLVLDSTPANNRGKIFSALNNLQAGGSTAGGAGLKLAYEIAYENYIPGGNNRVILATDGDFNVGPSSDSDMIRLIQERRDKGIFLTITGFGMGNYKDSKMEEISNAGNGNYFYIDDIKEAKKVFVNEMRANLFTIAKDVKIQIEFNPEFVSQYRLIGYENRILNDRDFNDDIIDAGELGAGHTVTALYEIIPIGNSYMGPGIDDLKYRKSKIFKADEFSDELLTVKFRYKQPNGNRSRLIEEVLYNDPVRFKYSSDNFKFSAAVAGFGMLLRDSKYVEGLTFDDVYRIAKKSKGKDEFGHRAEFLKMVDTCSDAASLMD